MGEVEGDSGRFSLGSCALLSPPSGGSDHHSSQCIPSSAPAVPAAIWKLGQVSVWAPWDVGHTLGHTRESFCS